MPVVRREIKKALIKASDEFSLSAFAVRGRVADKQGVRRSDCIGCYLVRPTD